MNARATAVTMTADHFLGGIEPPKGLAHQHRLSPEVAPRTDCVGVTV
jgi:hypothetical protein